MYIKVTYKPGFLILNCNFLLSKLVFNSQRYMCMLTNVISLSAIETCGAYKLISWKHTFKRLNEEYEIAQKKKNALDNLCASGKISQSTCDSFTVEITNAINEIEKQRHELAEKMNSRTQNLEGQIKTLEMLLANYEIQHVVGEIEEDIYNREITLLTNSLETTRNELCVMKDAINQLFPPQPITEQPAPEPVSLSAEASVESAPLEVQVETHAIEPAIIVEPEVEAPVHIEPPVLEAAEIATEASTEEAPIEVAEAEIECIVEPAIEEESTDFSNDSPIAEAPAEEPQIEITPDAASDETAPIEETIEIATVEAPIEEAEAQIDVPAETAVEDSIEYDEAPAENLIEEAPLEMPLEEAVIEESSSEASDVPLEDAVFETPIETESIEATITEETPLEDLQAAQIDQETQIIDESNTEVVEVESVAEVETIADEVVVEAPEEPVEHVPLHTFDVTEHEPLETTLEKVIETTSEEHVIEPVILGEANIQAHPLEAPHQAPTEDITEADADQTSQEEESEEDTTE